MSYLQAFTNQLNDFLDKLSCISPTNTDLKTYKTVVLFIKKTNPKKLMDNFYNSVYKYKTEIMNEDEQFFFHIDEEKMENMDKEDTLRFALLKEVWKLEMTSDTRKKVWLYLQVLIKLCEKYYDLR
jgi:hypothetical protein